MPARAEQRIALATRQRGFFASRRLNLPGFPSRGISGQSSLSNRVICLVYLPGLLLGFCARAESKTSPYPAQVQKILTTYCYDCHGDGMEKGKVAFDSFSS